MNHRDAEILRSKTVGTRVVNVLNETFHQIFEKDSRALFIGEDILDPYGGAFKVAKGLSTKYPERVIPTPISEAGIVGLGSGLAIRGFRPIVEIMFGDFTALAFDQLLNHISKFRSMYNNQVECPVFIRTPMGGRRGYGPTHSQTLDKYLMAIPNITVLSPSVYHDLRSLYLNAFADSAPKIMIENKLMYGEFAQYNGSQTIGEFKASFTDSPYPTCSLSPVEFRRADLTLIAYGAMSSLAVSVSRKLFIEEEIVCEVVIPSQLSPVNLDGMFQSLERSGRCLIAEEGTETCGFGAEVGFQISSMLWRRLKSPVARLTSPNDIIPSSKKLEEEFMIQESDIYEAALKLVCDK